MARTVKNISLLYAIIVASAGITLPTLSYGEEIPGGHPEVGIVEKLGKNIPLDLVFKDEAGKNITLAQIANGKPLIIDMAYYGCPGICDVVMGNLAKMISAVPQVLGKDFNVATVSFNPADKPSDALKKKRQFWEALNEPSSSNAWRFLTGDSESIYRLTNAMGFYFREDGNGMYMHPTALIFVNGKGEVVRYIQGTSYAEADVRMALSEAAAGSPAEIISSSPQVCFDKDPAGYKLTDRILQIGAVGTMMLVAGFLVFTRSRKKFGKDQRSNG